MIQTYKPIKALKTLVLIIFSHILLGCNSSQIPYVTTPKIHHTNTEHTTLGMKAKKIQGSRISDSTVYLVSEGTEAFLIRMALLRLAEHSVDLQYFVWKSDLIGKMLFHNILLAADRGVQVRILLDDITLDTKTKKILYALAQHKHIEVRIYNPISTNKIRALGALFSVKRINRRMHNKSFTADGQYTIVGGRNIETNYFTADIKSNYADLDLVSVGPIVKKVNTQFNIYWNSGIAIPVKLFKDNKHNIDTLSAARKKLNDFVYKNKNSVYTLEVKQSKMYTRIINDIDGVKKDKLYKGKATIVYDDPQKTLGKTKEETVYLTTLMQPYIDKVQHSLDLISPYFVPGSRGIKNLADMVKRGIKIRVITNSLSSTDGYMAQSGYARHRLALLKAGVELYELKAEAKTEVSHLLKQSAKTRNALHAKIYIFDKKEVYIGSFNIDPRSANLNTELGIVCTMPNMAAYIAKTLFDENIKYETYKVVLVKKDILINKQTIPRGTIVWIETLGDKKIYHTTQPQTTTWQRFNEKIYSLLPIESQL